MAVSAGARWAENSSHGPKRSADPDHSGGVFVVGICWAFDGPENPVVQRSPPMGDRRASAFDTIARCPEHRMEVPQDQALVMAGLGSAGPWRAG